MPTGSATVLAGSQSLRLVEQRKEGVALSADPPSSLATIYDLARLEFASQFQLSERYDAKVRNTLGLATLVFGIAQAALTGRLADAHHVWRVAVLVLAGLSLVALGYALIKAAQALFPSTGTAMQITGGYLFDQLKNIGDNEQTHFALVTELVNVVTSRQEDAKARAAKMKDSQIASIAALSIVSLELVVQLAAVVFG